MSYNSLKDNAVANVFSIPPCGLVKNLTWTQDGATGVYLATITNVSQYLTANSKLSCSLQGGTYNDLQNAWLIQALPSSTNGGTITFYVASNPVTPTSFTISWSVVQI